MKRLKEIGKALKSVVLSMAHMDYQMEFKKRKKPTLNVLEACHRLALSEGHKEKRKKEGEK